MSNKDTVAFARLTNWLQIQDDSKRACVNFWLKFTKEQRAQAVKRYEELIAENSGEAPTKYYTVLNAPKGKRAGDPRPRLDPMPHMIPHWKRGLEWLKELIELYD
jgi:hypothetical protein